mmetsp:Transcript_22913/g.66224  ORF Transcript_22913/g.66224 Transcript_22913/m.66224 type:complete len:251 (-) Transcript_22913:136-888(-)
MPGYGALPPATGGSVKDHRLVENTPRPSVTKPKALSGPIFLENPDGSITEAVPSTYKDPRVRKQGRRSRLLGGAQNDDSDDTSGSEAAAANLYREVDFLYTRHERVLLLLLTLQFALEVLYHCVYVIHMRNGESVIEFTTMYGLRVDGKTAAPVLWTVFGISVIYSIVYYIIAGLALWTKRPKQYRLFANYGIAGIVGLILLAYVDKFNLIIFFLHLLAYIYARFLQGLTASLLLLPPAPAQAATGVGAV